LYIQEQKYEYKVRIKYRFKKQKGTISTGFSDSGQGMLVGFCEHGSELRVQKNVRDALKG
jgi:hypothetical protein